VGWFVLCVWEGKISADLNHLGHLPYQLLKTVYKLPFSSEKKENRNQFSCSTSDAVKQSAERKYLLRKIWC
jgi:hypothetical protein